MGNIEFNLTKKQAAQVDALIEAGAEWIKIGNERIRVSTITAILEGATDQVIQENLKQIADKRRATDEGIREARKKLEQRLKEVKAKKNEQK